MRTIAQIVVLLAITLESLTAVAGFVCFYYAFTGRWPWE